MPQGKYWNPTLHRWVKRGEERAADYSKDEGDAWALLLSYWRWYPDRMLAVLEGEEADYSLTFIQCLIQRLFARYQKVFVTGSRGTSKTYNAELSKLGDGVLWPGEQVRYFAPSLRQAAELADATFTQIRKNYPALASHFNKTQSGSDTFELVTTFNSSFTITTMRGDNCHQVLCEEVGQEEQPLFNHAAFRNVVSPAVRKRHMVDHAPDPDHIDFKKHYITSACRQTNEAFQYRLDIRKAMKNGESAFTIDIPWQIPVLSGIRDLTWAEDLQRQLTPEEWMREMESIYTGTAENPVIRDEMLTESKKLQIMETHHCQNPDVFYVLGYDVSYENGPKMAKCAAAVLKLSAQKPAYKQDTYLKQLVYVEDMPPAEAAVQARYLKDLWRRYSMDGGNHPTYIAIDNRQYGKSVTEQLLKDMGDGLPICCLNHEYAELEQLDALPIIYPIVATTGYRDTGRGDPDGEMLAYAERQFELGNVQILTTNIYDGVEAYKRFHRIKDSDEDARFAIPYAKCKELCGQIMNLTKKQASTNWKEVRISRSIQRDMWSAFKYALRLTQILERQNLVNANRKKSKWAGEIERFSAQNGDLPSSIPWSPRVPGRRGKLRLRQGG